MDIIGIATLGAFVGVLFNSLLNCLPAPLNLGWHDGVELPPPPENTPIYAMCDGVAFTRPDMAIFLCPNDRTASVCIYRHVNVAVKNMQKVKRGDVIAYTTYAPDDCGLKLIPHIEKVN